MTFNLDWSNTNLDGSNTLTSGSDSIGVSVSTPKNGDYDEWTLKNGALYSNDVCKDTKATITFGGEVTNVSFTIQDVDCFDEVTIYAKDADGNLVPVTFEATGKHVISGTSVVGKGNSSEGPGSDTTYDIDVHIAGPITELVIVHDDTGAGGSGGNSGAVAISDITFGLVEPEGDGIVEGTGGDDLIDLAYTGDPDGDLIDAGDAILPGEAPNDDIVVAGDGDDTVFAGEGNDEVYGNGGSDTLHGEDGDDILIGDAGGAYGNGAGEGSSVQEVFKWSALKDSSGGKLTDGEKIVSQTQDTGDNTVTLTLAKSHDNTFSTDQQKVHSIDTGELPGANPNSSLESELDDKGDSQTYALEFEKDAENISFRVNDIDYDSTVVITAYDAEGNQVPVTMSAGSGVALHDNDSVAGYETAVSKGGGGADTSPTYSALVSIPGPVSKIVITHTQDGNTDSGVNITDIYFDTVTEGEGEGEPGDDTIFGGAGDDYIEGNAGDDYLDGGEGADTVLGGDGADTIIGGAGDVVDGGAGGNDDDTLDLSIGEPFYLTDLTADSNGNGWNGTVVYVDADGNPTGQTMSFTEIENINGTPVNRLPVANDDTASVDEDGSVTIPVLANDSDPDGDPLTVSGASADHGTVTVNPDGTITYEPDPDFNGTDTITYTVDDGNGGTTSASVTVTVNPVNDDPVANDDAASVDEGETVTIPVLANDSDVDGDPLTVSEAVAGNGTVTINPDGTLSYTPDDGFTGEDTITYTVDDGQGGTDVGTVAVTVNNVNDDPDAVDDTAGTDVLTPVTIDLLVNDTDPDGDPLTIDSITQPAAGGSVIDNGDGTVTFTPDGTVDGDVTFDYTVSDGNGGFDTATVTVTVRDGIVEGTAGADVIDAGYTGDPEGDVVDGGDNIFGGGPDDDIIDAGAGDDLVNAGVGDDTVYGGDGDDTIIGGDGSDTVHGGDGDDVIDTSGNVNSLGISGSPDQGYPGIWAPDADPFDDRDTVYGGDGDDIITTGDDDDTIYGGDGDDRIDAGFDDDTVEGGDGDDYIVGGEGSDTIDGGDGDDTIYGGLDPAFPDALNIPDDAGDLRPDNGDDVIHGGDGDDRIFGQDDDDILYGDDGDDYIDGGVDDDTIFGGTGNDTIIGGQGVDAMSGGDDRDTFIGGNAGDHVDGGDGGDDYDTLDLTGSDVDYIEYTTPDREDGIVHFNDGGTMTFEEVENVIPCFTPGTLIATPRGEVAVEELKVGDKVITRDNGIQEIRWLGRSEVGTVELMKRPELRPVRICQGALGNGLPERDMLVSPQHRVLVASDRAALYFEEREVLLAAKHLVNGKGIAEAAEVASVTYIHFMFDQHEVVLSDGAWTESFQPGDYTLDGIDADQREELLAIFPELREKAGRDRYAAARKTLKKHEALLLSE